MLETHDNRVMFCDYSPCYIGSPLTINLREMKNKKCNQYINAQFRLKPIFYIQHNSPMPKKMCISVWNDVFTVEKCNDFITSILRGSLDFNTSLRHNRGNYEYGFSMPEFRRLSYFC